MRHYPYTIILILSLLISSCKKDSKMDKLGKDIALESAMITLPEAGFTVQNSIPLANKVDEIYTQGLIEYYKNGEKLGCFDFSKLGSKEGEWADENGYTETHKLKIEDEKYIKIVIEPLVTSSNCSYIVSGEIKYYDAKTEAWLATVNFGDGTCDDIGYKIASDGKKSEFKISDYYK